MKNLIKFFIMMAVLCTITACSQAFEDISNNKKKEEISQGRLVMNVGNGSRSIIPAITENDIKSATLTVSGTRIKSWSGTDVIGQIESDNSILLDVGIYDFEMTFNNENGNVFLIGTIDNKEIKSGNNSLIFDMKLVQGNGNIAIGLSWVADDGISKIKAGLYDIATGEAVENYETEELRINGTLTTYSKNDIPSGQYIIKFEVYDTSDKLLNTLTDVIKVISGITTTEQKILDKVNTQYTITYDLAGGSWKVGFTPVTVRNANTGINLPKADNVEKTNYALIGWYDENGDKVAQIASGTKEDATFTAKWGFTADTVAAAINALSGDGPHDIIVTGVITSDTVTSINNALKNNSNAKVNLDLSDTTELTSIGDWAFYECKNLTSITIPDSVASIGNCAFSSCSSLTSFNVGTNNENYSSSDNGKILFNKDKTEIISYPSATEDITIPESVTSIGKTAFYGCSSLTSITIPDSVTSIGNEAFYNCSSLTSITIPDSVTSIGMGTFFYCSSLTSVTIPDSVTSIGEWPFYECSSLTSVTIGNSVTSIGNRAFYCCYSLESVTIPDSVASIDNNAFSSCSSLTSFNVGINNENYSSSDNGKILFNKDKTEIISYPSATEDITIPESVTSIGKTAFYECSSLTSVTIPDSVIFIDNNAFSYCYSLESVTIGNCVTSIGNDAFSSCSSLTSFNVGTNNKNYSSSDDGKILYNKDKTEIISYPSATGGVIISDNVTSIGNNAFSYCSSLKSIVIPDSVTSIGEWAFYGCSNLTTVNYKGTQEQWEEIDIGNYNGKLTSATINYGYTGE